MISENDIAEGFPARWYEHTRDGSVDCRLCARYCRIAAGKRGFCFVRRNRGGRLYTTAYGNAVGLSVDPVEKKPLYHFYPGSSVLSFGTLGCNMACMYCQNWEISRPEEDFTESRIWSAEELVGMAVRTKSRGIAYTYNEPVVFGEWMTEVASIARREGLKNVMVTNGYVSPEAREEIFRDIDAANVDLKSFTERFYHKLTGSRLAPVLETLRWLASATSVWVEITTLLIPGENDSPDEIRTLAGFIAAELGNTVPLHLTAFHGDYRMSSHPSTSRETLIRSREIALETGLKYVYTGNTAMQEGRDTCCPSCGKPLVIREPYSSVRIVIAGAACPSCRTILPGRFPVSGEGSNDRNP